MNQLTNILSSSMLGSAWKTNGAASANNADLFSDILSASLKSRTGFADRVQAELDKLASRNSGVSVGSGKVADGVKAAKDYFASGDKSDQVALDQSVLASMVGDSSLAKTVQDAISGFLNRSSSSNLMDFGGSTYAQRSLTITMTSIRYGEDHYSGQSDELLAASELKTGFHDKLSELIKKFFGGVSQPEDEATETTDGTESPDEATGKEDGTEAAAKAGQTWQAGGLPWGAASVSVWSLEVYYASSFTSSFAGNSQSGSQSMAGAWEFGASFASSMMSGITSRLFPQAIGMGDSSLQSFLENVLNGFGLESGGFRSDGEGATATIRQRRNLLAELMELYEGKKRQTELAESTAAETTEAVEETEALTEVV